MQLSGADGAGYAQKPTNPRAARVPRHARLPVLVARALVAVIRLACSRHPAPECHQSGVVILFACSWQSAAVGCCHSLRLYVAAACYSLRLFVAAAAAEGSGRPESPFSGKRFQV